ncbi:McrC family protein [Streptomyces sp. RKAG293]|uniref:McrC family protein n=1 Tax=Streptomyces sp. RKAG293 TaxID=2893403 RepID=UPI002033C934|nr:McrC family protein [Streptomyces sp. RKAG293]MCM2417742.1 McrC family protein [Streptomyces sp. RKAG293]
MPERTEIRLGEYQSARIGIEQLTSRDVDRLHALQDRGGLTLTPDRTGWRLKADATVGVLILDRVRLVLEPKFAIPGAQLMRWLAYALAAPVPHQATARPWATDHDGYADLIAAALLAECQALLRDGLRRDYVRQERLEPLVRGRLDVAAQATRRYGQLDQLHVRTFDREPDIWDNRVLGTALKAALPLARNPDLARALHQTAAAFSHAPTPGAALRALDRVQYTRLNVRYHAAHSWARLLLRGGGVTDILADHGATAESLLLAMPALWESVVRRLVSQAAAANGGRTVPAGGATGITVRGDLGNSSTFRPDVLVSLPARDTAQPRLLPVDAKYKRYDRQSVGADDVHQLLTYIAGYAPDDTPTAVIIHPQPGGHTHRTLRVVGPARTLGTIHVLGIDTHATPDEAVTIVRSALR